MAVEAQLEPSVLTSAAGEDSMSSGSLDVTSSSADSSSDEGPPLSPPAQYEVHAHPTHAMCACLHAFGMLNPPSSINLKVYRAGKAERHMRATDEEQLLRKCITEDCVGLQPTKWHTSATAEPAISGSSEGSRRADGSQGASTSGGQPVDYIFSFLPQWRQQEIATARQATGEHAAIPTYHVYQYRVKGARTAYLTCAAAVLGGTSDAAFRRGAYGCGMALALAAQEPKGPGCAVSRMSK